MSRFVLGALVGAVITFAGVRLKQRRDALAADAAVDAEIARLIDALDDQGLCVCGQPHSGSRLETAPATQTTGAPAPMDDTLAMAHLMYGYAVGPRRRRDPLPH